MIDPEIEWLSDRLKTLQADRVNFNTTWERIARVLLPTSVGFTTTYMAGTNLNQDIFDSTGQLALPRFAAAIDTLVTPQTSRWHTLKPKDKRLRTSRDDMMFLDYATDQLFSARMAPTANFQSRVGEAYMSLGAFGNGPIYTQDMKPGLMYLSVHLAEIWFDVDANGLINAAFWAFERNARQIKEMMDRAKKPTPEIVEKELRETPKSNKKFKLCKAVYPRTQRDPRRTDKKNMQFASTVFLNEGGYEKLEEGGYRTFPFSVARYVTAPREIYARGPAHDALADVLTLQAMARTGLRYGELVTDPPWLAMDADDMDPFSVRPGAVNYGYLNPDGVKRIEPLRPEGDPRHSLELMEQRRTSVNTSFLVTLFQVLVDSGSDRMTATEVMERTREKGALLAPVGGRLRTEFLGPMIERELDILFNARVIDPKDIPDGLRRSGGEIEIEYDSPLTRAMRAEEGTGILRTFEQVNAILPQLTAADQARGAKLARKINFERGLERLAEINGAPADLFNADEEVDQAGEADANAAALQNAIAAAPQIADATKKFAQAGAISQSAPVPGATPGLV